MFNPVVEAPPPDDIQSVYHTPVSTYLHLPDVESLGDRRSIPDTIVCTKFFPMDMFLIFFFRWWIVLNLHPVPTTRSGGRIRSPVRAFCTSSPSDFLTLSIDTESNLTSPNIDHPPGWLNSQLGVCILY